MSDLDTTFEYHERTKHHFHRYARSLGYLDWANQPCPFRYYTGAEVIKLDLERQPSPLPYEALYDTARNDAQPVNFGTLADFLRYGMALSAWKQAGGNRWALRINPSSGNLHPTEAYLLLRSLPDVEQPATLYHYVSEAHSLERRASFSAVFVDALLGELPEDAFLVGLSSILWREAWKYGERAFRYCQHDVGHALSALRFSAVLCGWNLKVVTGWSTEDSAALLGLNRKVDFVLEEHEESELLAVVMPQDAEQQVDAMLPPPSAKALEEIHAAQWFGRANRLSRDHVAWSVIDEVAEATRVPQGVPWSDPAGESAEHTTLTGQPSAADVRQVISQRRSCQALDGSSTVARNVFLRMMASTVPGPHPPWDALAWSPTIHLAVFVHRVDGLSPGLYMLVRDPEQREPLAAVTRKEFRWETPPGVPTSLPLYLLLEGDYRDAAKALSCHQDIASDGFFSLGMIAQFAEKIQQHGAWFYRNLFWEAGMIGQVLYLEAEAAGFRSTGIGCYFDDSVHDVLGLSGNQFQSLYHFTVGVPVEDRRLQSLPPYKHLDDESKST